MIDAGHDYDMATDRGSEKRAKAPDEKFCGSCGEAIKQEAEICPHCGVRQHQQQASASDEDPAIIGLISFLVPGAGNIVLGQTERGVLILGGYFAFWFVAVILTFFIIGLFMMMVAPLLNVVAGYDAYNQAKKIQAGEIEV